MEVIITTMPDVSPSHLEVVVDRVTYEGEPSWEVKQPGQLVVDAKLDSGVAAAFASTIHYITGR